MEGLFHALPGSVVQQKWRPIQWHQRQHNLFRDQHEESQRNDLQEVYLSVAFAERMLQPRILQLNHR